MRGEAETAKLLQHAARILLPTVVFGELLSGFKGGSRERTNREQLIAFMATERVHAAPITTETAEFYALVIHQLRAKGTPIPTNDIWIAALTMEHGASLATADDHFSKIDGLNLVVWDNASEVS